MAARKRKAVPARLSPDHLPLGCESGGCDPEVNGSSDCVYGSGNGCERAGPEVGWCHVSGDVMDSIRSVIGAAPTMEDKQRRLNAMIHQLQVIRNQLMRQVRLRTSDVRDMRFSVCRISGRFLRLRPNCWQISDIYVLR